ncbi:SPOR domain-containing protein [Desulfocurvus vexinensis]|uniref:SPOR domain-containing protein n=1 Tax=Desulfocurvus vexinensis TaxID=399548 RepID=UPI0004BAEF24|nr:SPOR domain-containing protein [Desulfocurvus vexinensis]
MHRRLTHILILAALALAPALAGCAASGAPGASGPSLMERFHNGQDLMADAAAPGSPAEQARQHYARGQAHLAQGRQELAFEQFSRAAKLDPALAPAREARGHILLDKGLLDEALAEFQHVIAALPDYAPAHEAAGMVYFRAGLHAEAREHLTRAVALDPTRVRALVHLGALHNARGDHAEAVKAFEAALRAAPHDGTVHNNLGLTHSLAGDHEKAVAAFRAALRLGAPSAKAYNNMGLALARLGRDAEALEAFRCAGGEAGAYNNLGYFYFMEGRYAQAVASFQRAIELEPTYYARAHENLKRARLALRFEEGTPGGPAPAALRQDIPALDGAVVALVPGGPLTVAGSAAALPAPAAPRAPARTAFVDLGPEPGPAPTFALEDPAPDAPALSAPSGPAQAAATPVAFTPQAPSAPAPALAPARPEAAPQAAYTVHCSSWRQQDNARREAERLRQAGHDSAVVPVELAGSGQWWRVTVGAFATQGEARQALDALRAERGNAGARVVRAARPAPAQATPDL